MITCRYTFGFVKVYTTNGFLRWMTSLIRPIRLPEYSPLVNSKFKVSIIIFQSYLFMQESVLNVVDFDETLFRVPGFTGAGTQFAKPYEWFDSPESLDLTSHRIQLIETVNLMLGEKDTNIILSHRVASVKSEMIKLLKAFKIRSKFDEVILCERATNKAIRLVKYLEDNAADLIEFNKIRIFEDSLVQLHVYMSNSILSEMDTKIEYWFVDKTEVLQIPNISILTRKRIELKYT